MKCNLTYPNFATPGEIEAKNPSLVQNLIVALLIAQLTATSLLLFYDLMISTYIVNFLQF